MPLSLRRFHCFLVFSSFLFVLIIQDTGAVRPGDDQATTRKFESQTDDAPISMTRDEISQVAGEAFAKAVSTKLNRLTTDQLGGVAESLARSKNPKAAGTVLQRLTKAKALQLAAKMTEKTLSRQMTGTLLKGIKEKFSGDLSGMSKDDIKRFGPLLKLVSPDDIKKMAKKNKDVVVALSEAFVNSNGLSERMKKAIAEGVKHFYGKPDTWDKDTVRKFARFASPDELEKMNPRAMKEALDQLANNPGTKKASARKIISRLEQNNGIGTLSSWNATTVKRLGELVKGLEPAQIKEMQATALKDSMEFLGKQTLSKAQARAIMDKIAKSKPVNQWGSDDLKKARKLVKGLSKKAIESLPTAAIQGALEDLGKVSIELNAEQRTTIAKKLDQSSRWTIEIAKKIGNLCYGKSSSDLKTILANVAKELVAAMIPEKSAPQAKNRILKTKVFSAGAVNLTIAGPVISAMTLNDLKNTDPRRELGLDQPTRTERAKPDLPWGQTLARQLIDNYKRHRGQPDTWTEEEISALQRSGVLTGCSREDFSKMKHFFFEEFADVIDTFLPAQRQAVIRKYKGIKGIKTARDCNQLTEPDIEGLGDLTGEFSEEEIDNMQPDVAVEAIRKIGKNKELGKKPRELIARRLRIALKKMGRESMASLTEDDILDLGNVVCGLSPEEITKIPITVLNATKYSLGERKCFSRQQLEILAKKAKESTIVDKMTSDDVLDLGCIIEGFTADDLRKIKDTVVQKIKDTLGSLNLTSEQATVLKEKLVRRASRRRRNTDVSTMTGQELVAMGNMLLGFPSSDIARVDNAAFDEAASTIGKIDGFTQQQVQAWAAKAKQAWNSDIAQLTEDQLLRLGVIAIGFSDSDLEKMALSSDDVIESLGSQKVKTAEAHGYTPSQLNRALNRIKTLKSKTINQFTGDEITNLNNFALALTVEEIGSIPKETFANCIGSLGKLNDWSKDQMTKLKEKAVQVHGLVSRWSPAKLRESGSAIGGFTKSELQSLSGEHITVVTPEAIQSMPPSLFAGFTSDQLKQLDYNQATAATSEQMDALPEDLKDILKTKTGSIKPEYSGGAPTNLSQLLSVAIIVSTMMVMNH